MKKGELIRIYEAKLKEREQKIDHYEKLAAHYRDNISNYNNLNDKLQRLLHESKHDLTSFFIKNNDLILERDSLRFSYDYNVERFNQFLLLKHEEEMLAYQIERFIRNIRMLD